MEQAKQTIQKNLWLQYFNRYLREQGVISEQEFRRLALRINTKYGSKNKAG